MKSRDKNGIEVFVGNKIQVLEIDPRIMMHLPSDEKEELSSFIGNTHTVERINSDGSMIVCQARDNPDEYESIGHEVAIFPNGALLVKNSSNT